MEECGSVGKKARFGGSSYTHLNCLSITLWLACELSTTTQDAAHLMVRPDMNSASGVYHAKLHPIGHPTSAWMRRRPRLRRVLFAFVSGRKTIDGCDDGLEMANRDFRM